MQESASKTGGSFLKSKATIIIALLFASVTVWWLLISPFAPDLKVDSKHYWSASYGILSLFGGISGIIIAKYWGGFRSVLGRSILAFAAGLLLQTFGQFVYNYYTLFSQVEAPYPSLGDLGYFGSIPAYIYGVILLGRAAGLRFSFKSYANQILALLIPLVMLILSYVFFLRSYEFDWSSPLTVLLDFGYPLGQAVYVSIALLVLVASRKLLGGLMKKPLLFLLIALIVQYLCDFNFLYQAHHERWYAGGPGDYLYAVSYFLMTSALIYLGTTFKKIRES